MRAPQPWPGPDRQLQLAARRRTRRRPARRAGRRRSRASVGRNSWLAALADDDQDHRRERDAERAARSRRTARRCRARAAWAASFQRGTGAPSSLQRAQRQDERRARSSGCRGCAGSSPAPCARRCRACTSSASAIAAMPMRDEQHAGPEILGIADRRHADSSSCAIELVVRGLSRARGRLPQSARRIAPRTRRSDSVAAASRRRRQRKRQASRPALSSLLVRADQTPFFARRSLKYLSSHCACMPLLQLRLHFVVTAAPSRRARRRPDHVPAELRLHRLRRELALRRRVHRVAERLHEVGRRVPVEIAARSFEPGSFERALASSSNLAPFCSSAMMSFASSSFSTRMWRTLYSLSPICALIVSYSLCSSDSGIGFFCDPVGDVRAHEHRLRRRGPSASSCRRSCRGPACVASRASSSRVLSSSRTALRSSGVSCCALGEALLQQEVELALRIERLVAAGARRPSAGAAALARRGLRRLGAAACASAPARTRAASDGDRDAGFVSFDASFRQEGNSSGAYAWIASACTGWGIRSPTRSSTARWRARRVRPGKCSDTMVTEKCPPPAAAPAWPACSRAVVVDLEHGRARARARRVVASVGCAGAHRVRLRSRGARAPGPARARTAGTGRCRPTP